MRTLSTIGLVTALTFALLGCRNNNAKAEQRCQEMVDGLNKLADCMEKGDKAGVDSALAKMRQIGQSDTKFKMTVAQSKEIEAKFKPQVDNAFKRIEATIRMAISSGKFTRDELVKIGNEMTKIADEMEAMGK